jgi:hypothetical protein
LPSQTPFVPHDAAPASLQAAAGSPLPAATLLQVPAVLADALHDLQVALHSVAQQTPCRQNPDLHSVPSAHTVPFNLRPHDPLMHTAGEAQSALVVQAALQVAAPHRYGAQERAAGLTHLPLPSQVEFAVNVGLPLGQVASAQEVPLAYFWQAPAWHLPLVPQLAAPWSLHMPAGSALPVATLVQAPSVPASAHDWQAPPHALSQQYPWAQNPLLH